MLTRLCTSAAKVCWNATLARKIWTIVAGLTALGLTLPGTDVPRMGARERHENAIRHTTPPTPSPSYQPGWTKRWAAAAHRTTDAGGQIWQPDAEIANGGTLRKSTAVVTGTGTPHLYQNDRLGVLRYTVPVPTPGTWVVVLYLATTDGTPAGGRTFDASAGSALVQNIDATRVAGQNRPTHVVLRTPVWNTKLTVYISPRAGKPAISALALSLVRPATSPLALAYSDEFAGGAGAEVGPQWTHETGPIGWWDGQLQAYTARPSNASLDGKGHLIIAARRELYTHYGFTARNFTSARLNSRFSAVYGRIEANIKIPPAAGVHPAFWMLGRDIQHVGWPSSGEIDILESLGALKPDVAYGTIHGPGHLEAQWRLGGTYRATGRLSDHFHRYAVEWWPGIVQLSVDGSPYASFTPADLARGERWVAEKPYYLLLNVSVGGSWGGPPSPTTAFPQTMAIDWVRWWR